MANRWTEKGATISDKNAEKLYGIPMEEIYEAIDAGKLRFQEMSIYGNPWFRLLHCEVEAYFLSTRGIEALIKLKEQAELKEINKELKELRNKLQELETRKAILTKPGTDASLDPRNSRDALLIWQRLGKEGREKQLGSVVCPLCGNAGMTEYAVEPGNSVVLRGTCGKCGADIASRINQG